MNLNTVKLARQLHTEWEQWDHTANDGLSDVKLVLAKRMLRCESDAITRLFSQGATLGAILDLMVECGIGEAQRS